MKTGEKISYSFQFNKNDYLYIKDNCSEFNFFNSSEIIDILNQSGQKTVCITIYANHIPIAFGLLYYCIETNNFVRNVYIGDRFGGSPCIIDKYKEDTGVYEAFLDAVETNLQAIKPYKIIYYPFLFIDKKSIGSLKKYKAISSLNLFLDMRKNEKNVRARLRRGVKAAVNYATKNGLKSFVDNSADRFKQFCENFFQFASKNKIRIRPWITEYGFNKYCNKTLDLFCVSKDTEIMSIQLIVKDKTRINAVNGFVTENGQKYKAGHLIFWEEFLQYKKLGYEKLFLGGVAARSKKPDGYGAFKLHYHPDVVNYNFFEKSKPIFIKLLNRIRF